MRAILTLWMNVVFVVVMDLVVVILSVVHLVLSQVVVDGMMVVIADEDFEKLNSLFNREELSTLCSFIAFISGANKFGIIVGLSTEDLSTKKNYNS